MRLSKVISGYVVNVAVFDDDAQIPEGWYNIENASINDQIINGSLVKVAEENRDTAREHVKTLRKSNG